MPRPYNLTGREGTYGRIFGLTGLGDVPSCLTINVPPGFVGPINCDPTNGPPNYPVSQNQISAIWDYLNNTGAVDSNGIPVDQSALPGGGVPSTLGDSIKANWPWLVAGLAAVMLIRGR